MNEDFHHLPSCSPHCLHKALFCLGRNWLCARETGGFESAHGQWQSTEQSPAGFIVVGLPLYFVYALCPNSLDLKKPQTLGEGVILRGWLLPAPAQCGAPNSTMAEEHPSGDMSSEAGLGVRADRPGFKCKLRC